MIFSVISQHFLGKLSVLQVLLYPQIMRYIVYGGYIGVTLVGQFVGLWTFPVNTISQQPLVRNQYNFTRMIDTKPSCAYCQCVALDFFLNELWPLEFFIHMYIVRHQLGVF